MVSLLETIFKGCTIWKRRRMMTLSRAKAVIILLLAALTIYQTGVLWFVNITNRNFLLNYFPFMQQAIIPEGLERLVTPWRIITVHGDGRFSVQYNGLVQSNFERYSDIVLSHLLQRGRFISVGQLDYETLLAEPAYIYEYAFPMEAEWFTLGFGQRGGLLTAQGMAPFRQVIIRPPAYGDINAHVFFLCENGYAYEFTVAPLGEGDGRDTFDHAVSPEASGAYYIFVDLPGGGGFIRHGEFAFYGVRVTNPYADIHGGLSLNFVQGQVAGFFSNPAVIRPIPGEDVWVYRDVNTVVRYYGTNVLEYISYRAIDRSGISSFVNDYAAAIHFLERDHLVINEAYLADFREEYGQRIFYFNYVIGDIPLIMPQNWPRGSQLSHPVIITVDHGIVVRYRKLAYNFHIDEETRMVARADFYNLANRLGEGFTDVRMGYRMANQYINNVTWFVDGLVFSLADN